MDLQALTEAEFVALIDEVARERDRRAVLATTQQVVEQATAAYGGDRFVAVQGHTTQTGWEPPHVPALWGRA